ncbi:MAG TPA: enoyl-CoA hydratase [Burkholderiales bacterium]|nr:enoyl-CoA hydratase [Burkholderiales bacterium]
MSGKVLSKTRERIARIELSRPDKKNALTAEMYAQLTAALDAAARDPQVRVILLCGSAECFTAGNDVSDFLERKPGESPVFGLFQVLPALEKPVVAAVGGPAVGIGTTLLLHCDFVLAAEDARFQLPFVPLGIVPEFGSTLLLPRLAGYQRAAKLLLLGQPFTAREALDAGIVTDIVSKDELLARAERTASMLAALPPESLRLTKRLMKQAQAPEVQARIAEEGRLFVERLASPEAKEAMSAFLEKRKPDFSRF